MMKTTRNALKNVIKNTKENYFWHTEIVEGKTHTKSALLDEIETVNIL